MFLLLIFAFLAGIATVLSPCILPLLPIILSSANGQDKQRPIGVVLGFVASFTFFTLFLSSIVKLSGVSADSLRTISVIILALFGVSLLVPAVQVWLEKGFSKLANFLPQGKNRTGLAGGVVIGLSLGLLWTPCVGPILASVISLAITGTVTGQTFLIILAYALGTALPMLLIMIAGSTALQKVPWLVRHTSQIQKFFGVLMILTAFAIALNFDSRFQTVILQTFPGYGAGLTKFEETELIKDELEQLNGSANKAPEGDMTADQLKSVLTQRNYPTAPDLIQGGDWFNSQPLTLEELRGKVVLIDFWTYSCINCQRTMPYLRDWWEKYQNDGLVIIGVHSPEFEFEKDPDNLAQAIADFELQYPIMQDNNFATWKAYNNRYWPAKYLLDKDGEIRYTHFGEGKYDQTEEMIQKLLAEAGAVVSDQNIENQEYQTAARTPELYLGSDRIAQLASPEEVRPNQAVEYSAPNRLPANSFTYQGTWTVGPESANPNGGSKLLLNFEAQEVYLVVRPKSGQSQFKVSLDGQVQALGEDNQDGLVTVDSDRLYKLVKLVVPGKHQLELEFADDNLELFAFTFG